LNNEDLKALSLEKFVLRRERIAGVFELSSDVIGRSGVATEKSVFREIEDWLRTTRESGRISRVDGTLVMTEPAPQYTP
jgi:hypothetical protein